MERQIFTITWKTVRLYWSVPVWAESTETCGCRCHNRRHPSYGFEHDRYDITGPALVKNGELIGARTTFDKRGYHWIDKDLASEYRALLKQLPGAPSFLELISTDKNWDRLVLKASGNKTVPQYYLYSRGKYKKSLTALFSDYPKVDRTTIAEPTPIQYKSRDGMDIPGYLTLPVGIESKNLPTLIMPHGGPYSRDTDRFDYWVSMRARGYAVLQPNSAARQATATNFVMPATINGAGPQSFGRWPRLANRPGNN